MKQIASRQPEVIDAHFVPDAAPAYWAVVNSAGFREGETKFSTQQAAEDFLYWTAAQQYGYRAVPVYEKE